MADDRPILHIGLHKTASTWFQIEFYPNCNNCDYVPRRFVRRQIVQPRAMDFNVQEVRDKFDQFSDKRLILCEEELSGNIHVGGLNGFATAEVGRRLKKVFPEAQVIIFERDFIDHLTSTYQQYVKKGGNYSPRRYFFPETSHYRRPAFSLDHFNVKRLKTFYEDLYSPDQVDVFDFENFKKDNRAFIADFAGEFDLQYDSQNINWKRRVNRGYGKNTIWLAKFVNLFTSENIWQKFNFLHIPYFYTVSRKVLKAFNLVNFLKGSTESEAILGKKLIEKLKKYKSNW